MYELLRHRHRIYMLLLCIYFTCMPGLLDETTTKTLHTRTHTQNTSIIEAHTYMVRTSATNIRYTNLYGIFVFNEYIWMCVGIICACPAQMLLMCVCACTYVCAPVGFLVIGIAQRTLHMSARIFLLHIMVRVPLALTMCVRVSGT